MPSAFRKLSGSREVFINFEEVISYVVSFVSKNSRTGLAIISLALSSKAIEMY